MGANTLRREVIEIAENAGASQIGVAFYDYHTRTGWSYHADTWFHAASTIKIPVLVGVFGAIRDGRLKPEARLHVRNRFISVADGKPYHVSPDRDANSSVHAHLGRTMRIRELAHHMISTSSNLATNLLVDIVGVDEIRRTLQELGIDGIDFRRGVEDEKAWEDGLNNTVTANGLLTTLRRIVEHRAFSKEASEQMLEILHAQEFRSGIPAGLPDSARVAHKTGEISTVAHDAGVVFLPEREPYVVAILTEWEADRGGRSETIARISRTIFHHLTEGDDA